MTSIRITAILLLLLLCPAAPPPTRAQKAGTSASGSFRIPAGGLTKTIDFNARTDKDGASAGEMTFAGPTEIPPQDVDGAGQPGFTGVLSDVSLTARFDCLEVDKNKAVMSGVITASSLGDYIGRRVLLVVEDNGEGDNAEAPDRLTWGVYKENAKGWTPSDAELRVDPGVGLTWVATDYERDACPPERGEECVPPNEGVSPDAGVPSHRSETVTCKSFPLSSYSLSDVRRGDGNIQVRP